MKLFSSISASVSVSVTMNSKSSTVSYNFLSLKSSLFLFIKYDLTRFFKLEDLPTYITVPALSLSK
mgnify:CR=1 FL=1